MLMAARPASVGALDLFKLALELAEANGERPSDQLDHYVEQLLVAAKNLLDTTLVPGAHQPDAIQLALTMSNNPELGQQLRAVQSLHEITPAIAHKIRQEMGLEVAS